MLKEWCLAPTQASVPGFPPGWRSSDRPIKSTSCVLLKVTPHTSSPPSLFGISLLLSHSIISIFPAGFSQSLVCPALWSTLPTAARALSLKHTSDHTSLYKIFKMPPITNRDVWAASCMIHQPWDLLLANLPIPMTYLLIPALCTEPYKAVQCFLGTSCSLMALSLPRSAWKVLLHCSGQILTYLSKLAQG